MNSGCAVPGLGFVPRRPFVVEAKWQSAAGRPRNPPDGSNRRFGVMGRNRVVGSLTVRVFSLTHFLDGTRRLLDVIIIFGKFGARASKFRRGICTSPPADSPSPLRHWFSQTSIMNPPDGLKQLQDFDRASPQFHNHLSNFLRSEGYRSAVPNLQGEDLTWLVEYLDSVSLQTVSP